MANVPYYFFAIEDNNNTGQMCEISVEYRSMEYAPDENEVMGAIKTALESLNGSHLAISQKRRISITEF